MRGLDFFSQTFLFLFSFFIFFLGFLGFTTIDEWWDQWDEKEHGDHTYKSLEAFSHSPLHFFLDPQTSIYISLFISLSSTATGNWELLTACVQQFMSFLLSSSPPDLCLVISTGHADLTCFSLVQSYRFYLFAGKQRAGNEHIKMMMMRRRCGRAKRGFNLGERERERECHVCVFFFFFSFL